MEDTPVPIPDTIRYHEIVALGFTMELKTRSVWIYFQDAPCAGSGGNFTRDMSAMFFEKGLEIAFDRYKRGWRAS